MKEIDEFEAIVSCISDAILVLDDDGVVLFANPSAEQLFGRSGDMVGELFGFPIETRTSAEIEIFRRQDPRYAEMRVVDFEWDGKPAILASLRDTTDRKRAEELQSRLIHSDRLASIGQLASGVAHEINNPATYVLGNLTFMLDNLEAFGQVFSDLRSNIKGSGDVESSIEELLGTLQVDEKLRDFYQLVRDNVGGVNRIVNIVKDLRSFSRIERDEVELVNLNDVVNIACNMTANVVRHRAQLVKDLGQIPLIEADRGKLSQVVINLLINAAHAIEEGASDRNKIIIRTWIERKQIVLSVEDTGSGISEMHRERIFEPFFTTKPREQGTGLGLSLSADIVRQHGGDLNYTSPEGEGACFFVTLPVETPMQVSTNKSAPACGKTAPFRRARILLIDDEDLVLRVLHRVLEREHDVVSALGGKEALQILTEDQAFDVLICDLMMPEVDGVAIYEEVSNRYPELLERIVFCSGGVFTKRVKDFTSSVRNPCLQKPVEWDLLLNIVDRYAQNPQQDSSE